ncbi:MAG: hypothetical protein A2285_03955 [Elusimicrobia bacterium RIFOXYA12_FULL_57_11]|nr:MAG: hypothetical protein A2285_03955 [Elusimicrobia bacterium RIFOXYA12_FULL_57_11]
MRRILFALAAALLFPLQSGAQQVAQKELVLIRDYDDVVRFGMGLMHAIQRAKAGAEVRVVFEANAVMAVLMFPLPPQVFDTNTPAHDKWIEREDIDYDYSTHTSDLRPRGGRRVSLSSLKFAGKMMAAEEITTSVWNEFKKLKIKYTVCSFSATILGFYDTLKLKGEPLSPDQGTPVDIAPYIRENYQLSVF